MCPESPPYHDPEETGSFDLRFPFLRDEFNQTSPTVWDHRNNLLTGKKKNAPKTLVSREILVKYNPITNPTQTLCTKFTLIEVSILDALLST